ncbi:MAG: adenosylcobinamide amidohydrolase [Promethearchaeota archaeon]
MSLRCLKTPLGDDVYLYPYLYPKAIVIKFNGKRNVVSTSIFNGGYAEHLKYVYNYDGKKGTYNEYDLEGLTYEQHLIQVAKNLGLSPSHTTGISTTADMKNASLTIMSHEGLSACAIITAGTKGNAARAGDPSSFDERKLSESKKISGTINMLVQINARLSPGTLTRALITCTEAKSVALQELLIGSKYSTGIATGTGTDGCILIGNMDSSITLTNAGKHSKLGELIGRVIIKGVKRAIAFQENLTSSTQNNLFSKLERYKLTPQVVHEYYNTLNENKEISEKQFEKILNSILQKYQGINASLSLLPYLLDEYQWNILSREQLFSKIRFLFNFIGADFNLHSNKVRKKEVIEEILSFLKSYLVSLVVKDLEKKKD